MVGKKWVSELGLSTEQVEAETGYGLKSRPCVSFYKEWNSQPLNLTASANLATVTIPIPVESINEFLFHF